MSTIYNDGTSTTVVHAQETILRSAIYSIQFIRFRVPFAEYSSRFLILQAVLWPARYFRQYKPVCFQVV